MESVQSETLNVLRMDQQVANEMDGGGFIPTGLSLKRSRIDV